MSKKTYLLSDEELATLFIGLQIAVKDKDKMKVVAKEFGIEYIDSTPDLYNFLAFLYTHLGGEELEK